MYGDLAKDVIEEASRKLASGGRSGGEWLHVVGASYDLEYVEEEFRGMFPEADMTTDFVDFIGDTTDYYVAEGQQPVVFGNGTAYVRRIRAPDMENLRPELDYVVHEVEIEGSRLPDVETVERTTGGVMGWGNRLTAKGGIRSIDLGRRWGRAARGSGPTTPGSPGSGRWLMLRRSIADHTALAYYLAHGLEDTPLEELVRAPGFGVRHGGETGLVPIVGLKGWRAGSPLHAP